MIGHQQLSLPPLGTAIPFEAADVGRSSDGYTYMCRITFDKQKNAWVIASRLNQKTMRWEPIVPGGPIGLMVFLNETPISTDVQLIITAIKKSGKAAWADPRNAVGE